MFLSRMERNLLLLLLFMSFITDGSGQDNGMRSLPDLVYIIRPHIKRQTVRGKIYMLIYSFLWLFVIIIGLSMQLSPNKKATS